VSRVRLPVPFDWSAGWLLHAEFVYLFQFWVLTHFTILDLYTLNLCGEASLRPPTGRMGRLGHFGHQALAREPVRISRVVVVELELQDSGLGRYRFTLSLKSLSFSAAGAPTSSLCLAVLS